MQQQASVEVVSAAFRDAAATAKESKLPFLDLLVAKEWERTQSQSLSLSQDCAAVIDQACAKMNTTRDVFEQCDFS